LPPRARPHWSPRPTRQKCLAGGHGRGQVVIEAVGFAVVEIVAAVFSALQIALEPALETREFVCAVPAWFRSVASPEPPPWPSRLAVRDRTRRLDQARFQAKVIR
jgi:hypothetical protein